MARAKKPTTPAAAKAVTAITHDDTRKNIPTAEYQPVVAKEQRDPIRVAYERRNKDRDPQLVWRGKDVERWGGLVVHVPPLYIQEKVHPKALIDDLLRRTRESGVKSLPPQTNLFADFNGMEYGGGPDRVLRARPALDEPDDPGGLAAGDGEPRRAREATWEGTVHLFRSAVWHQV